MRLLNLRPIEVYIITTASPFKFVLSQYIALCTFPVCASLYHLVHTGSKLEVKVMHPDGHCK